MSVLLLDEMLLTFNTKLIAFFSNSLNFPLEFLVSLWGYERRYKFA